MNEEIKERLLKVSVVLTIVLDYLEQTKEVLQSIQEDLQE